MYLRQMKQLLRNARPDFDERRYGSLQDLLRACQKAGLVRLERDRQGGLRAFAGTTKSAYMPQGWVAPETETAADQQEASAAGNDGTDAITVTEGDVIATVEAPERAGRLKGRESIRRVRRNAGSRRIDLPRGFSRGADRTHARRHRIGTGGAGW